MKRKKNEKSEEKNIVVKNALDEEKNLNLKFIDNNGKNNFIVNSHDPSLFSRQT